MIIFNKKKNKNIYNDVRYVETRRYSTLIDRMRCQKIIGGKRGKRLPDYSGETTMQIMFIRLCAAAAAEADQISVEFVSKTAFKC